MRPGIRHRFTIAAAVLLLAGGPAAAGPIELPFFDGQISFAGMSGTATPTGGTGVADATGIDFSESGIFVFAGSSEDFADIPFLTPVTFFDIEFASSAAAQPLWQIAHGGTVYEFFVERLSVTTQTSSQLTVQARGYLSADGYQDTSAGWLFALNNPGPQSSWASTTTVPEPGTLALLAAGLAGLVFLRRRRPLSARAGNGR